MNRAKLIPLDHYWKLLLSVHLYSPLKPYITVQWCQTLSVSTFSFCYHPRLSDPMSNHIPTHRDESILGWFDQTLQGPDRLFFCILELNWTIQSEESKRTLWECHAKQTVLHNAWAALRNESAWICNQLSLLREAYIVLNENQAILKSSLGEALMTEPPALTV